MLLSVRLVFFFNQRTHDDRRVRNGLYVVAVVLGFEVRLKGIETLRSLEVQNLAAHWFGKKWSKKGTQSKTQKFSTLLLSECDALN